MIDGTPEVTHLAVDLQVDLVDMPTPLPKSPHSVNPLAPNVGCK